MIAGRRSQPFPERGAVDLVDAKRLARLGEGDGQGRLGEAVDGIECRAAEPVALEAVDEPARRHRIDGLRAVHGEAPGAEIDVHEILLARLPQTEAVSKVGRDGDGRPEEADGA